MILGRQADPVPRTRQARSRRTPTESAEGDSDSPDGLTERDSGSVAGSPKTRAESEFTSVPVESLRLIVEGLRELS